MCTVFGVAQVLSLPPKKVLPEERQVSQEVQKRTCTNEGLREVHSTSRNGRASPEFEAGELEDLLLVEASERD